MAIEHRFVPFQERQAARRSDAVSNPRSPDPSEDDADECLACLSRRVWIVEKLGRTGLKLLIALFEAERPD